MRTIFTLLQTLRRNGERSSGWPAGVRRSLRSRIVAFALLAVVIGTLGIAYGQYRGGRRFSPERMEMSQPQNRNGVPTWDVDQAFKDDVFTFVRIEYDSFQGWGKWMTDFPDADLNLSFRLQQLTSLKVDPNGRILRLTDPDLFRYPFIYLIEPGHISLNNDEIVALRRYLLNGGFLMVDDFWGESEWYYLAQAMKQVFPDREPVELPLEHPIFHCVYDLKEKPQIPAIGIAQYNRGTGITWERPDSKTPHYKGIFDDKGRMMAIICHNTDLGDGWEREGEDPWYFTEFSEKKAYPLGINIIFYAMTH
jgi:hypothetical protein